MKQFDNRDEIKKMRKMYDNSVGIHDKMDMKTFAIEFYGNWLKQLQRNYEFWKSYEPQPEKKKKVVVKIKRKK